MIDVQGEALFLAVPGDTLNDVETKALVVRLSCMLPEKKAEIVLNTLATLDAEALVERLADTLQEGEAKTLGDCQTDSQHLSCRWLKR